MTPLDHQARAEGLAADDVRHGTTRGFHAGCRDLCCRRAISRYQKGIRYNKLCGRRLSVPAIGAQRRIKALMALGWTGTDIATACDWSHRNHVRRILVGQKGKPCTWVERKTHDTIARVFESLAMQTPPREPHQLRTKSIARRKGYLPPLAWDDIDDPNEQPREAPPAPVRTDIDHIVIERILAGEHLPATVAERREVVARWPGTGRTLNELARMTGWNTDRYREDVA